MYAYKIKVFAPENILKELEKAADFKIIHDCIPQRSKTFCEAFANTGSIAFLKEKYEVEIMGETEKINKELLSMVSSINRFEPSGKKKTDILEIEII